MLKVTRLALAVIFMFAGVAKTLEPTQFRKSLLNFYVPQKSIALITPLIPALEIFTGLMFLSRRLARTGSKVALLQISLYMTATLISMAAGKKPTCNCFGSRFPHPSQPAFMVRNGFIAFLLALQLKRGSTTD